MLWIKALHIISMVAWFSGLFYLPRLYVYHTQVKVDAEEHYERFCTMERKLLRYIMNPAMILTLVFGGILFYLNWQYYLASGWMHAKLTLVTVLICYHHYLARIRKKFVQQINQKSEGFFRWLNEVPTVILVGVVILVVVRPF